MRFYVIHSIDAPDSGEITRYYRYPNGETIPGDDCVESEYRYLADEDADSPWADAVGVTWEGEIDRETFDRHVYATGAIMSTTETMGSLTVDYGWLPAVAFEIEDYDAIHRLYVTPMPERGRPPRNAEESERSWQRIRNAMLEVYS